MTAALTAQEYRLIVEHSPVMIWRSGTDAKCDYFNEIWLAYTGRTLEQELGDGWAEGVHPDDFERCVAHYLDHFERREPFEMEYRLRRHDGVYRWIFDRGVPFEGEHGFAGFIGSCVDVDARRRAQDARLQHNEQQLALARDFEKWVLAIVSHDVRNPLDTIQLTVELLKRVPDTTGTVKERAAVIKRAADRIQHIVGDLLDLSRDRQGLGIPIDPKRIDLAALCRQIVDELETIDGDREIHFECDVDATGIWDEHRILQAVSNLARNALQHSVPGTPVWIRVTHDERGLAVEVQNHGTIPNELLPSLFEPFSSVRQRDGRSEGLGLGLGLFIAQAIARAHNGSLDIDSADGLTRARLVLPQQTVDS